VLYTRVQMLTNMLQTKVVAKLTNQVLHVRSGLLRSSVNSQTTTDGSKILGTVSAAGGAAHYGVYHENGIPHAWEIRVAKSRALAFQLGVKENARKIFARSVVHPPLAQRSFMRSALQESENEIRRELAQAVADVLKE